MADYAFGSNPPYGLVSASQIERMTKSASPRAGKDRVSRTGSTHVITEAADRDRDRRLFEFLVAALRVYFLMCAAAIRSGLASVSMVARRLADCAALQSALWDLVMDIVRKIISNRRGPVLRLGLASCRSLVFAGILFAFGSAVADAMAQPPAVLGGARADVANGACPATDFVGFLHAFSKRVSLQRRYTHFPLEFGLQDMSRLNDADEGFKKRTINSFEKIPNYDAESGTVFPSPMRISKFGLKTEITTIKNSKATKDKNVFPEEIINDPASVSVAVTLPDSGVLVFYLFKKMHGCWFLYAVSDRST